MLSKLATGLADLQRLDSQRQSSYSWGIHGWNHFHHLVDKKVIKQRLVCVPYAAQEVVFINGFLAPVVLSQSPAKLVTAKYFSHLAACCSMVSTTGGNNPRKPSASLSSREKAVPLLLKDNAVLKTQKRTGRRRTSL